MLNSAAFNSALTIFITNLLSNYLGKYFIFILINHVIKHRDLPYELLCRNSSLVYRQMPTEPRSLDTGKLNRDKTITSLPLLTLLLTVS